MFAALSARLVPSVARRELPASVLARMPGAPEVQLRVLLGWLAPLTTTSTPDGARFVRGLDEDPQDVVHRSRSSSRDGRGYIIRRNQKAIA